MSSTATPLATLVDQSYRPPQVVRICSIYPGDMRKVVRKQFGKEWKIPVGSPQSPKYFDVEDCHQGGVYWGQSIGERITRILAIEVANDIINEVTLQLADSNASEDAYPGIFICESSDGATREEIAIHAARQRRYFERQVKTARELHRMKQNDRISPNAHIAARELGVVGEDWQENFESGKNVLCPWCSKGIPETAKKCPECQGFTKPEYAAEWHAAMATPITAPKPVAPPVAAKS